MGPRAESPTPKTLIPSKQKLQNAMPCVDELVPPLVLFKVERPTVLLESCAGSTPITGGKGLLQAVPAKSVAACRSSRDQLFEPSVSPQEHVPEEVPALLDPAQLEPQLRELTHKSVDQRCANRIVDALFMIDIVLSSITAYQG